MTMYSTIMLRMAILVMTKLITTVSLMTMYLTIMLTMAILLMTLLILTVHLMTMCLTIMLIMAILEMTMLVTTVCLMVMYLSLLIDSALDEYFWARVGAYSHRGSTRVGSSLGCIYQNNGIAGNDKHTSLQFCTTKYSC
jgi:hypothetical protein